MSSYSEGYQLGYRASAPIGGLSEGIEKFNKEYLAQQKLGEERQKAFDDARKAFKLQQEETYGKYAKEDLYDDTGFTDFDSLGDKFTRNAKELYELNEFAFRNGFIDEAQLTSRNNNIKNQSQKLTTLYDDANAFIAEKKKLDDEGKSNPLNELKLEMLEEFSAKSKITPSLDGLFMSTLTKDGNQRNISVSDFNKILTSESGLDLNSVYDGLLENQGFKEFLSSGKKITSYTTGEDADMDALDVQLSAMTEGQQLGALLDIRDRDGNKIATSNKKEAEEKGLIYVGHDRAVDPSITQEEQNKLKEAMVGQLRALQERKQKQEIYRDPYAVRKTASQSAKEDKMRAAYEIAVKIGEGGEDANRLVDQVVANNEGIENIFLDETSDSYIVETVDKRGARSDFSIKVPRNEDGSVDSRNLGVSLMSAISPTYSVEQAELAARDFVKKNPDYNFTNSTSVFDRDYIPMPSLNSVQLDKNTFASDLITSTDADDLTNEIPKALSALGVNRGYKIESVLVPETLNKKFPFSYSSPFTAGAPKTKKVVRIHIPNIADPIFIEADDKQQIIDMIPDIAYQIKKSGNLIDNRSNRVESSGKKALPGKK